MTGTGTGTGMGNSRADFPHAESIWEGVKAAVETGGGAAVLSPNGAFTQKPEVAIVVFGETPYAEFQGDVDTLDYRPQEPLAILRRLQAAGVPKVSVFLSGRPLWTHPEINASNAFVAAWLPGSEGGALADVLISDAPGRPQHDFLGTPSLSWPKDARGEPLNIGQPGYDPQFDYGYGLSYARPGRGGVLSEDRRVNDAGSSIDRYFMDGRFIAPWSLMLRDAGGEFRIGQEPQGQSPRGVLTARAGDGRGQESARILTFAVPAGQTAQALIAAAPVDLTRQSNGEMAIALRYRIDAAPTGKTSVMLGAGAVDVTSIFAAAPARDVGRRCFDRTERTIMTSLGDIRSDLTDLDDIPGTRVFTATRARLGYHLNQFAMSLMQAANRTAFKADERAYLDRWPMTDAQKAAVLARDYNRCLDLGGNIYFLAKLISTDGMSVAQGVSTMTDMSFEAYTAMMIAGGRSPEGLRSIKGNY